MSSTSSVDLASLLCSRLCHDMLSPVGALNNGLELLVDEQDPDMRARCFELLEQSARSSADKLKFFRLAFGAGGSFAEAIPVDEPRALVEALVANNARITLNWVLGSDTLPKPAVKILLNFALLGLEALPRGGTLDIGAEHFEGQSEIVVRAVGPRIAFDENVGRALEGTLPESELSSRTAPAAMLYQLASSIGGQLQHMVVEDALILGAVLTEAE